MLRPILRAAVWLDTWLDQRLGRPYAILLTIGLTAEIVRSLADFRHRLDLAHVAHLVWLLPLNAALLIHQVASLHHIRERRIARKVGAPHEPPRPV